MTALWMAGIIGYPLLRLTPAWPPLGRVFFTGLIFLLAYCFTRFVFCSMLPDHEPLSRSCPHCGAKMKLARVINKLGALPTLTTFQCLDCREVITVEDDR
jgi:hypothetical protein